jgi:hypothetical protein
MNAAIYRYRAGGTRRTTPRGVASTHPQTGQAC